MNKINILLALLGAGVVATAQAETAHQHGVANLNIAISKLDLMIELHTPADNVLGFEFMPKTDQQKQKLSDSLSLLKQADSLFEIPKQAQCSLKQLQIDNPFEPKKANKENNKKHDTLDSSNEHETHEEHKHDDHSHEEHAKKENEKDHKKHDEHETHADFEIQYSYHCQQPDQLTGLKTDGLFKHFPNFVTLKVQWVNDSQQSAATVTKEALDVSFNP
jgi:hypothetical protein